MKKIVWLLRIWILIYLCGPVQLSAQQCMEGNGCGMAGVAMEGVWMSKVNPAGLADSRKLAIGVASSNRFLLKELTERFVTVGLPVKRGLFAASYQAYGAAFYRQTQAALAYGCHLGKYFSAGVKINYHNIHFSEEYTDKSLFTFDLGIRTKVTKDTYFGIKLFNPEVSKNKGSSEVAVPSGLLAGFLFRLTSQSVFYLDMKQNSGEKPVVKTAIKFTDHKAFSVSAGISTEPAIVNIGVGLRLRNLTLDFSSEWHQILGFSPSASILFEIKSQ